MPNTSHNASLRLTFAATALIGTLAATGCVIGPRLVTSDPPPLPEAGPEIPSPNKAVLAPGTQVVADTAAGHIKIEAGPGLRRVFDWDGLRRGVITKPREKLFAGASSEGLYFDGKPKVWKPAKDITKLRYEESYRNFETIDDAMIWMQIRRLYYSYNNDGLVIGWKRRGDTLQVEVWQFTIDGKKPISLPDSKSAQIVEGPLQAEPQKMHPHLVFNDGHTEPYTTDNASKYKGGGTHGADTSATNQNSEQSESEKQGWFSRHFPGLFGGGDKSESESSSKNAGGDDKPDAESSDKDNGAKDSMSESSS